MDSSVRYDVGIVGGGPAGARAAWRLSRSGARVVMFDGSHPREKPCGGGVTGRALDLVRDAIDSAALPAVAIEAATFEHGANVAAMSVGEASGREPPLAVMSRRIFDQTLLDAAARAGARLVRARARTISHAPTGWTLQSSLETVRVDWLLGADGPNSLVRRTVAEPFARGDLSIAAGFYVHGCTSSTIAIAFEDEPAGYLWSFPRPDHLAVGACAQADESRPAALLGIVSRWLERNVGPGLRLERYSWPIPSLSVRALDREKPSGARWLLLGDAGGMVDPITREGIYFALASGDAAAHSLQSGDRAVRNYDERIRDTVHAELRRAAALKARFFSPQFTSKLIEALQASAGIRGVMIDLIAGTQPYRGLRRRLLRTGELRVGLRLVGKMWGGSRQ
jgi:geranylgeranyl reductase family protein